jgi:hypothetical protein
MIDLELVMDKAERVYPIMNPSRNRYGNIQSRELRAVVSVLIDCFNEEIKEMGEYYMGKFMNSDIRRTMVEDFNKKHPVGTTVFVVNNGVQVKANTRTKAELLGGSVPAICLEGIDGIFALDKIIIENSAAQVPCAKPA